MARSDYIQGRKLKALSAQEAADEALTDKLAQLNMNAIGKTPEYEYDAIGKKLQRKIKGPIDQMAEVKARLKEGSEISRMGMEDTPDTSAKPRRARRSSMDMFLLDQATNKFIKETRQELWDRKHKKTTHPEDTRQKAETEVEEYLYDYQRKQRQRKTATRRELTTTEMEEAKKRLAEKNLQLDDALRMDDADEEETKMAPEELERQRQVERQLKLIEDIPKIKDKYNKVIGSFKASKNYNQYELFKAFKASVGNVIDARTSDNYFDRVSALQPKRTKTTQAFSAYVDRIKNNLNANSK
ncbi:hypothetical protein ON010_g10486 [Phytophthora cinnamomi]|nr:hypothetical protein ON010_g10486 [Phytophthora cinnamomi]